MRKTAPRFLYLFLLAGACISVISCIKHREKAKIAATNEQVIIGNWEDIRNYKPAAIAACGCAADLKFKEHIILACDICSKPEKDCYPPYPELKGKQK